MNNTSQHQILKVNYCASPQSFHPHLVSDIRTQTICKALFEGLTRVNAQGKVELAIAEKVDISPCKTIYTFTLKPSKWSNGKDLTSYHFADAWKEAISSNSKCTYAKRFFLIKNARKAYTGGIPLEEIGIYTPSDNKLVIELEYPAPYFLQLVADPVYSPIYDTASEKEKNVFNGPFVVESYDFNKQINLSANPFYWDAKSLRLKKIEISLVKDIQTALFMYENGSSNWLGSPFTDLPDEIIQTNSNVKSDQGSAPFWVFCNIENPKLKSTKVRKALSYVIDREEIIKHIIPHQKALYSILPKDLSSINFEHPLKNNDLKMAIELFEQGLKEIGINRKDFELILSHSNIPDQKKIALYLKHQWEKILGIKIILKGSDWNSFYSNIKSGKYEVGGLFICNIYDDPSYLMESFEFSHSNYGKWENKDYQKYFTLAKQSLDEKQRKDYLKKAEEILMEEMPVIPIYNHAHLYLCKDGLENFSAPKFNYADFKYAYYTD